jgi:hypothetical protein
MTPLAQRIAIAKALGATININKYPIWTEVQVLVNSKTNPEHWNAYKVNNPEESNSTHNLPNYLSDLNAMHEAELWLISQSLEDDYLMELGNITGANTVVEHWFEHSSGRTKVALAPCSQRAEAFLRTLSLWEDEVPS